jgi:hypothetical protein
MIYPIKDCFERGRKTTNRILVFNQDLVLEKKDYILNIEFY